MCAKMNRDAYDKLIDDDLIWLLQQPHSSERDHIECVLHDSPERLYTSSKKAWDILELLLIVGFLFALAFTLRAVTYYA